MVYDPNPGALTVFYTYFLDLLSGTVGTASPLSLWTNIQLSDGMGCAILSFSLNLAVDCLNFIISLLVLSLTHSLCFIDGQTCLETKNNALRCY